MGILQVNSFLPDGPLSVKLFCFIPAGLSIVGLFSNRRQQVFPLFKVVAILSKLKISTYVLNVVIDPYIFWLMVIHNVEVNPSSVALYSHSPHVVLRYLQHSSW